MARMDVVEEKLLTLEKRSDLHESRISHLESNFDKFQEILAGIQKTLQQIKWVAMGAVGMFILQEMGIITLLKTMM